MRNGANGLHLQTHMCADKSHRMQTVQAWISTHLLYCSAAWKEYTTQMIDT